MSLSLIGQVIGGIGIFLLALSLLTQGLRAAGGSIIQKFLGKWTATPLKGITLGVVATAVLQSSTVTTVMVIGLVNAAVLSLAHAIYIIFGANIGTTTTGWMVSMMGLGFNIKALALPAVGIGMALTLAGRNKQGLQAIGYTLTGFGLFFIGVEFLREAFSVYADAIDMEALQQANILLLVLVGVIITLITQSSSAAVAIIVSGAAGGLLPLVAGAGLIIGANLGTTATALIAVIGASADAKRTALSHLLFNVVTALVILLLLPQFLSFISWSGKAVTGHVLNTATSLAYFHTLFSVFGVMMLTLFVGQMAKLLNKLFQEDGDDIAKPRYLDSTTLNMPALAVGALQRELASLHEYTRDLLTLKGSLRQWEQRRQATLQLSHAIDVFAGELAQEQVPAETVNALQTVMRINRYMRSILRLMPAMRGLTLAKSDMPDAVATALKGIATEGAELSAASLVSDEIAARLATFTQNYEEAKQVLLAAGARKKVAVEAVSEILDQLSDTYRLTEQATKARRWLNVLNLAVDPKQSETVRV